MMVDKQKEQAIKHVLNSIKKAREREEALINKAIFGPPPKVFSGLGEVLGCKTNEEIQDEEQMRPQDDYMQFLSWRRRNDNKAETQNNSRRSYSR